MVDKGDGLGELVGVLSLFGVLSFIELYLHSLAEAHIIDEVERKLRVAQLAKFFQGLA
jgi:hypothetical protein